jgi:hypothetical protein
LAPPWLSSSCSFDTSSPLAPRAISSPELLVGGVPMFTGVGVVGAGWYELGPLDEGTRVPARSCRPSATASARRRWSAVTRLIELPRPGASSAPLSAR